MIDSNSSSNENSNENATDADVSTRDASAPADSRIPPAQNTANASPANLQTNPPTVPLPLTSSTGTGFDAPDAGTTLPAATGQNAANTNASGQEAANTSDNAPLPQVGNIDRDALAGENAPAGSQIDAEAVSSTGPV